MLGLRTQESEKFNHFFELVQKAAAEEGKVFFCDCGEGREFETQDMEGEDLSGWLIPAEKAEKSRKKFEAGGKCDEKTVFCIWSMEGEDVFVRFEDFSK